MTPILVKKNGPKISGKAQPPIDDLSLATPTRMGYRVSFIDDDIERAHLHKRHGSVQPRVKDGYFGVDSRGRNQLFPPFIPDDPEKPHLSSRKKEKSRRAVILEILREILRYKKADWDREAMNNQKSMFDNDAEPR